MMRFSDTAFGVICVAASAAAFSTAGLFARVLDPDVWTMLFWRGVFGSLMLAVFALVLQGKPALSSFRLNRAGWVVALCSSLSTICFIAALRLTTVADVTITFATTPFLAAGLAWLWSRRREKTSTLVASAVAFCGVLILASQSIGSLHSMAGIMLALLSAFFVALMMVVLRHNSAVSFLPAACISGLLCALLVLPAASPLAVSGTDFLWLVAFGTVQFALGLLLLIWGAQRVSPARAGLISSIETPLAPLLVWLAFAEAPGTATLIGGSIVMFAVIADILLSDKRA